MIRDAQPVTVGVRAIDVGYFNVKYTKGRKRKGDANVIDVGMFPSLAPKDRTGKFIDSDAPRGDMLPVSVDGLTYLVGPGSAGQIAGAEPRPIEEDYATTAKYHALTLGALHYMAVDAGADGDFAIEMLVVGLPLNTWARHKDFLRDRLIGEHRTGDRASSRRMVVKNVHVMVQPQGTMVNFGAVNKNMEGWSLVVDPGGGTLDWYMAEDGRPNWGLCGAYPKAMLQCAYAVADAIKEGWRHDFRVVQEIDKAIRSGAASFMLGSREYGLAEYRPVIEDVLRESVQAMLTKTGPLDPVRRILLTGGGAAVYRDYLQRVVPDMAHAMEIDPDPVYSNVRGFQINGEVRNRRAVAEA